MYGQASNFDTIHQHLCAGKDGQDILGIHESYSHYSFVLLRVLVSPYLSMQSP